MPPRARKREIIAKRSNEEISTHTYLKLLEEARKLTREGMSWSDAERKVFGEFFKRRQK